MTFNEKITRLKEITFALEKEEIDLEQSLLYYEEGMKLAGECETILNNTKQKVMVLTEQGTSVSFVEEDENELFI